MEAVALAAPSAAGWAGIAALVLLGVLVGWQGRSFLEDTSGLALSARAWVQPALWLVALAAVGVGAGLVLHYAQTVEHGKAYWAQGVAAGILLFTSVLMFTAGRRRTVATEDITWTDKGPSVRVYKGQPVSKSVYDQLTDKDANCKTVRRAKETLKYKEGNDERTVPKGSEVPVGADLDEANEAKVETSYIATKFFRYKPEVEQTIKAGEVLAAKDALRPEAGEKTVSTRGLSFSALFIGKDGRWSTSKLQALVWTYAVLFGLLSLYLASASLGVKLEPKVGDTVKTVAFDALPLPDEYYLLLGGPFAIAILAKAFTASKVANGEVTKSEATGTSGVADGVKEVVSDDEGRTDLVDTQYFLFSLLAVGYFFASFVPELSRGFPEVPEVLVGLSSASGLAYITKKGIERSVASVSSVIPETVLPGQHVEVWGSNLVGSGQQPPQVQIDGLEVASVEVLDDGPKDTDHLRVLVPAGASGEAKLVVLPPGGKPTEAVTLSVQSLEVTAVEPTPVSVRAGAALVITGKGFAEETAANTVTLGSMALVVASASPTKLSATLNDTHYPQGDVPLNVSAHGQSDVKSVKVTALEITEVRPSSVPRKADQTLTVLGFGFHRPGLTARLGAKLLSVESATESQLVCRLLGDAIEEYGDGASDLEVSADPEYSARAKVTVVKG